MDSIAVFDLHLVLRIKSCGIEALKGQIIGLDIRFSLLGAEALV